MKYENKIKLRLVFGIFAVLLGLSAFILGIIKNAQNDAQYPLFYYSVGTGGGLIAVGIGMIKKNLSALADKKKMKALSVEEKDERNIMIVQKAGYFTFVSATLIFYIVSLCLLFAESALFKPLMQICSIQIGLYLLFYFIVRKIN